MPGQAANHADILAAGQQSAKGRMAIDKQKLQNNLKQEATKQMDGFMKIFLATLKKPNIDNPPDMMQLTSALASFSQVGEQVKTNQLLGESNQIHKNEMSLKAKSYLNKNVEFYSDYVDHKGGDHKVSFKLPAGVEKASLSIINPRGQVVAKYDVAQNQGDKTITWNGKLQNGQPAPHGFYRLHVGAFDKSETQMADVPTRITGVIDGYTTPQENEHDVTYYIGEIGVKMEDILKVGNEDRTNGNIDRLEERLREQSNDLKDIKNLLTQYLEAAARREN